MEANKVPILNKFIKLGFTATELKEKLLFENLSKRKSIMSELLSSLDHNTLKTPNNLDKLIELNKIKIQQNINELDFNNLNKMKADKEKSKLDVANISLNINKTLSNDRKFLSKNFFDKTNVNFIPLKLKKSTGLGLSKHMIGKENETKILSTNNLKINTDNLQNNMVTISSSSSQFNDAKAVLTLRSNQKTSLHNTNLVKNENLPIKNIFSSKIHTNQNLNYKNNNLNTSTNINNSSKLYEENSNKLSNKYKTDLSANKKVRNFHLKRKIIQDNLLSSCDTFINSTNGDNQELNNNLILVKSECKKPFYKEKDTGEEILYDKLFTNPTKFSHNRNGDEENYVLVDKVKINHNKDEKYTFISENVANVVSYGEMVSKMTAEKAFLLGDTIMQTYSTYSKKINRVRNVDFDYKSCTTEKAAENLRKEKILIKKLGKLISNKSKKQ